MDDQEIGKKYSRLTLLERAPNIGSNKAYICRCDCGKTKTITLSQLKTLRTKSCGCLKRDHIQKEKKRYHNSIMVIR